MNKQKYSIISIKEGLRSKQATTKCSIIKVDKQINIQRQHCKQLVYIYRDFAKANIEQLLLCTRKKCEE